VVTTIRRVIVTRILKELRKSLDSAFDEYKRFWLNFGSVLKEGLCEDASNVESILDLCLFYSATQGSYISLSQYLANASANQKAIYFLTGESLKSLSESPQIEGFLKWGVDVLLMTDTVDSFWLSMVNHYRDVSFVSVAKSNLDVSKIRESVSEELAGQTPVGQFENLCAYFKECLGDLVEDVRISNKLVNSPACLMIKDGGMDGRMERFLLAQNHIEKISPKIMEINFQHPVIQQINSKVIAGNCDQNTKELVLLILDQILLVMGEPIRDVKAFCDRMNNLIASKAHIID
jgi:molecular chaperone HtpG